MTAPPGALDYFALEAADCLARIERWAASAAHAPAPADAGADAAQAARALRGAATIARQPAFAALGAALERAVAAGTGGPHAADAITAAVDAFRSALRAPRPLAPADAQRLGDAASALDALDVAAGTRSARGTGHVIPVRALARDGDAGFVVFRAPHPPTTADRRFREASVPLARALRRLVADARSAIAAAGDPGAAESLTRTLGADVRAALADVRELAESYDVRPVAAFFAGREAAAAALDPRQLAAVDAAAAGLLGETPAAPAAGAAPATPAAAAPPASPPVATTAGADDRPTAPAPDAPPERGDAFRPPTGDALVALLETGISGFGQLDTLDAAAPAAPTPAAASPAASPAAPGAPDRAAGDTVVPVEQLLYRGRAALDRARVVRDQLRAAPGAPDPALLDELYDLLDLAAAG